MKPRSLDILYYGRFAGLFTLTQILLLIIPLPLTAQTKPGKVAKSVRQKRQALNHFPPIDVRGGSLKLESMHDFKPPSQASGLWTYEHSLERKIQWVMIWDGNQNPNGSLPKKVYTPPSDNACTIIITYQNPPQEGRDVVLRGGTLRFETEESVEPFTKTQGSGKYRYTHIRPLRKVLRVIIKDGNLNPNANPAKVDYTPPPSGKCLIKICYDCH